MGGGAAPSHLRLLFCKIVYTKSIVKYLSEDLEVSEGVMISFQNRTKVRKNVCCIWIWVTSDYTSSRITLTLSLCTNTEKYAKYRSCNNTEKYMNAVRVSYPDRI